MKQKRNWYTIGVITHLKNLTISSLQILYNRGSSELSVVAESGDKFDGVTSRQKDEEMPLSPSPHALTDSETPSVPSLSRWGRRDPHLDQLSTVFLAGRHHSELLV